MNTTYKNGSEVTDALIHNILETKFENIPQETVDNTKRRILDMIGCIIGGAKCDGSERLADIIGNWGGKEEASILGY